MDNQTPTPDDKFSARRRLLRGSFSVPAVLTLASGSALAAQSMTCLAKSTQVPSTADLKPTPHADTFVRVQVYRSGNTHYVWGHDFSAYTVSMTGWSATSHNNQYQAIGVNPSNTATYNRLYGNVLSNPPNWSAANYFAALRFNADGVVVGIGLSGSGSVVGNSCWLSMRMMPSP